MSLSVPSPSRLPPSNPFYIENQTLPLLETLICPSVLLRGSLSTTYYTPCPIFTALKHCRTFFSVLSSCGFRPLVPYRICGISSAKPFSLCVEDNIVLFLRFYTLHTFNHFSDGIWSSDPREACPFVERKREIYNLRTMH